MFNGFYQTGKCLHSPSNKGKCLTMRKIIKLLMALLFATVLTGLCSSNVLFADPVVDPEVDCVVPPGGGPGPCDGTEDECDTAGESCDTGETRVECGTGDPIEPGTVTPSDGVVCAGSFLQLGVTGMSDSDRVKDQKEVGTYGTDTSCPCDASGWVDVGGWQPTGGSVAIRSWTVSSGGSVNSENKFSATSPGTYTVSATIKDNGNDNSCDTGSKLDGDLPTPTVNITVVGVDKVIIDGSSPDNEGPYLTSLGAEVTVRAIPNPSTASFPGGGPTWTIESKPEESTVTAPAAGSTASITPDLPGTYVLKAVCGTSSDTITIKAYKIELKSKPSGDLAWDNGNTNIAAGGINSAVHKADIEISITPSLDADHPVQVKLTGAGAGYQPGSWWWSESQKKAALTLGTGTFTFGDSTPISITSTTSGTLISSNVIETTTIEVAAPTLNNFSVTKNVSFVKGDIEIVPANGDAALNQWHNVTIRRKLGDKPIDGHKLNLVVTKVTLKNVDNSTDPKTATAVSATNYDALDEYVQVDPNAYINHAYVELLTGVSPAGIVTQTRVIDIRVTNFELGVADMSVVDN